MCFYIIFLRTTCFFSIKLFCSIWECLIDTPQVKRCLWNWCQVLYRWIKLPPANVEWTGAVQPMAIHTESDCPFSGYRKPQGTYSAGNIWWATAACRAKALQCLGFFMLQNGKNSLENNRERKQDLNFVWVFFLALHHLNMLCIFNYVSQNKPATELCPKFWIT